MQTPRLISAAELIDALTTELGDYGSELQSAIDNEDETQVAQTVTELAQWREKVQSVPSLTTSGPGLSLFKRAASLRATGSLWLDARAEAVEKAARAEMTRAQREAAREAETPSPETIAAHNQEMTAANLETGTNVTTSSPDLSNSTPPILSEASPLPSETIDPSQMETATQALAPGAPSSETSTTETPAPPIADQTPPPAASGTKREPKIRKFIQL